MPRRVAEGDPPPQHARAAETIQHGTQHQQPEEAAGTPLLPPTTDPADALAAPVNGLWLRCLVSDEPVPTEQIERVLRRIVGVDGNSERERGPE